MADWFNIILDLEGRLTLKQIGVHIGRDAATIYRYKAEITEPKHSDGEKLIQLHKVIILST